MKTRKGDKVRVLQGKDRGKEGEVMFAFPEKQTVIVEGVNMMKKHSRPTQKNPKGGIITKEGTIHRSNVQVYCSSCSSPTRVSYKLVETKGTKKDKIRCCRLCGAEL